MTNVFELILLTSILATKQFQDHVEDRLPDRPVVPLVELTVNRAHPA